MRLILSIACVFFPDFGFAEERSARFLMPANVLICDTLGQIIASIEANSLVQGCGFTSRSIAVEVFREVPYSANNLTFELVRFEFPQRNSAGEKSTYIQYGFIGRPRSVESKSPVGLAT